MEAKEQVKRQKVKKEEVAEEQRRKGTKNRGTYHGFKNLRLSALISGS